MSEQSGSSTTAIQERQAALALQHTAVADADRVLAQALADAHAAMREGVDRLAAVAAEIDRVISVGVDAAVDTPMGAREIQRFLVAKQREVAAIVAGTRESARVQTDALHSLRARYEAVPHQG
jgi:Domain of unknown function (DUF4226)